MQKMLAWAAALIAVFFVTAEIARAEKRIALVVGNANYAYAGRLANPANDATDVAAVLKRLSFEVTSAFNLDGAGFVKSVDAFLAKARGTDVAVFYYAGHGLQYDGAPYLLPTDARLESELAIKRETIAAQDIVTALEGSARASVVALDACRNNPLADQLRQRLTGRGRAVAVSRGLGRIEASGGNMLVIYSAAPGQEAQDGTGRNSPFTAAFLKHAETPGLEVEQMLKRVTAEVERTTNGKQQPERLSRLKTELWLKEGGVDDSATLKQRLRQLEDELKLRNETAATGTVKSPPNRLLSKMPSSYDEYINKYPFDSVYIDAEFAYKVRQSSAVRSEWSRIVPQKLNESNIVSAIQAVLLKHRWEFTGHPFDKAEPVHEIKIIGKQKVFGEDMYIVAVYSSAQGYECHACSVTVSIFEFIVKKDGWQLGTVSIGVGKHGAWGGPPEKVQLAQIGADRYGVMVSDAFTGQGYTESSQTLIIPVAGAFFEVLSTQVGADDSGTLTAGKTQWDGALRFVPNSGYFFDIAVELSGKKDAMTFSEATMYQFDERAGKYIPQRLSP